ncbi:MAG: acyltransferase family protein [Actinomycetota bacterium]|nr:acyltransferase family protein [Actinomycetota bacterium]MDA3041953.1 acyltransferase family protein [Actinomycetota bacterium]
MSQTNSATEYRPEVDGLRAVAIVPVLLFHAGLSAFAGGFFGVDVFFVISGYLITAQLASSEKSGFALLGNFYHRRIRRLFPAIAIVSLVTAVIAYLIMTPSQLQPLFSSFTSTQVFLQNIYLWQNSGYWDQSLETSPLMHTWSLALEEQFYLIFPLLFVAKSMRNAKSVLIGVAITIFVLSFFGALTRFGTSSTGAFFLLPYRAWELMAGAIVALYQLKSKQFFKTKPNVSRLISNFGMAMIIIAIILGDKSTRHPGLLTLLPVVGTALLIAFGREPSLTSRLLSNKLLVAIGKLSYGLYLWHFPILALWRVDKGTELNGIETTAAMVLTFACSYLMWKFAETPFRDRVRTSNKYVAFVATTGFVALVSIGIVGQNTVFGKKSNSELALLEAQARIPTELDNWIEIDFESPISGGSMGVTERTSPMGDVVLLGDSHAGALKDSLSAELEKLNLSGVAFIRAGCPPVSNVIMDPPEKFNCTDFNQIIDIVLKDTFVTDVILFSRWTFYVEGTRYTNYKGYREDGYEIKFTAPNKKFTSDEERISYLGDQIKLTVDRLESTGKKVHLIHPLPELGWDPISYAKRFIDQGISWHQKLDIPFSDHLERSRRAVEQLDRAASPTTSKLNPADIFCDQQITNWCVASLDNTLYYGDNDHLNENGNKILASFVGRELGGR